MIKQQGWVQNAHAAQPEVKQKAVALRYEGPQTSSFIDRRRYHVTKKEFFWDETLYRSAAQENIS